MWPGRQQKSSSPGLGHIHHPFPLLHPWAVAVPGRDSTQAASRPSLDWLVGVVDLTHTWFSKNLLQVTCPSLDLREMLCKSGSLGGWCHVNLRAWDTCCLG